MNAFQPFNPYSYVTLDGYAVTRAVTLALPREHVSTLLPYGLVLGPQHVTPPGTHPVIMLFHQVVRAHMSVPTLLPSLSYYESIIGIPDCYLSYGPIDDTTPGPFLFEPRLYLDSVLAIAGGVLYWGFAKRMATFRVTAERFVISAEQGGTLTCLESRPTSEFQPIDSCAHFDPIRRMHDQPLVLMLPCGIGPFFVCANFDKDWRRGSLRPLETVTHIEQVFVPGLDAGTFPEHGVSPGIDASVLGSYEMRVPWRLGLPYAPGLSHWMRSRPA